MKYTATFPSQKKVNEFYNCFDWKMKRRSEGRNTTEVETKIFSDFIINVLDRNFWSYPLKVTYQDRPDFVIEFSQGLIGVEITEQWSKHYGKALSISEKSDRFWEPSDFNINTDTKKIPGKEIAKLVSKNKLTGPPSMGYEEEENWVKRTVRTIQRKIEKFSSYPESEKYDENFLLIFDVRPESPFFDDVTDEMLIPLYSLQESSPFSNVFFMDSHFGQIDLMKRTFKIIRKRQASG